jgi:hypothetical protein
MSKATLTEADFQEIVLAAELAIKETPPEKAQASDEVPKVRGVPPGTEWVVTHIVVPFVVAILTGVAKDISKYIAEGTINAVKALTDRPLTGEPEFEPPTRQVEKILKDMHFSKHSRQYIIGQVRECAEKISKKAKTDRKKAKL